MDARGRTHRLKNLDLYLDLSKERVVRYVGSREGKRESLEGADGRALAEMANAYGRSPEVRECKFYDQSGGLIRRRCTVAPCQWKRKRDRDRDVSFRRNIRIGDTVPITFSSDLTNSSEVKRKSLTVLTSRFPCTRDLERRDLIQKNIISVVFMSSYFLLFRLLKI